MKTVLKTVYVGTGGANLAAGDVPMCVPVDHYETTFEVVIRTAYGDPPDAAVLALLAARFDVASVGKVRRACFVRAARAV